MDSRINHIAPSRECELLGWNHRFNKFLKLPTRPLLDNRTPLGNRLLLDTVGGAATPCPGRMGDPASEADMFEVSESSVNSQASLATGESGGGSSRIKGLRL